jgi:large subunit ribosomal protein L18
MGRIETTKNQLARRVHRVRSQLVSTSERPRMSVHISGKNVSVQIIDDTKSHTLASATSMNVKSLAKSNMTEKAVYVGTEIAKIAKAAKVSKVVFDRGGKLYHGRIKALAESARAAGLEF